MSYPFRFLTKKSMAAIKQDDDVRNSHVKQGLYKRPAHSQHIMCGCDFTDKDPTCHFVRDAGKDLQPKEPPKAPQKRKKF